MVKERQKWKPLKEFQEIEYLNYVMAEYKKLANLSFGDFAGGGKWSGTR